MTSKSAVLLINLGTPSSLKPKAIRSYLREFLLDERVVDLPWPLRYLLVNCIIVPLRSRTTLKAYKTIWTNNDLPYGSPLLINSLNLQQQLSAKLKNLTESSFDVWLAMRYGEPSINHTIQQLQQNNYTRIIIVPLYPQYASATAGSALEKSLKYLSDFRYFPEIICLNEFYANPNYINAMCNSIKQESIALNTQEHHLLFSYHGLPKRQLAHKNSCDLVCKDNVSCPTHRPNNCYRAKCFSTSHLIAKQLNLSSSQYSTSFQSRLGKLPWVRPYTDEFIVDLRAKNITNLTIITPSFVVDCLETLEEIGIKLKAKWFNLGGKEFKLIPCLNSNADWVASLAQIIDKN